VGLIRLILARQLNPNETKGLYIVLNDNEEVFRCCCLELPWLNNLPDKSCIPPGIYWCKKVNTPEHPNSFLIENVPGREGIEIHIGNFATGEKINTLGCQLPGLSFEDIDGNGLLDVTGSTIAMTVLNYFLPQTFQIIIV
jgi:hypothetical protein